MKMGTVDCKRFESCSAQICPLDGADGIWYADEEICLSREFSNEYWIRNQRKIAKKTRDLDSFYTLRMLQQNCIIGKGISGIDPEHDLTEMEKVVNRWLKEHP